MHDAAALDHEPLHAAVGEVLAEPAHPHAPAAVDDRRHRPEPRAGVGHPRARGVDELLGLAGGEEVRARVEVHPVGHGDLHRRRREPAGRALVAAGLRAHEQPRVVGAHGDRADHDRVAGGAHLVDPVEVGLVGQREARRRGRRGSRRARRCSSAGCTGGQTSAAPSGARPGPAGRRRRRPGAAHPGRHEDGGARQAGDEHHHAVDDRGGDPA